MNEIKISHSKNISTPQLEALYNDAGWSSYTRNLVSLQKSIQNSQDVVTAWDKEKLLGLIRTIGDTETILYIQDILVLSAYKRQGIGRRLIEEVLALNQNCRQVVLLTEDNEESRGFYEALGFESCDKGSAVAFAMQK
jgi:ribosomal protein S18 acetylase RimI-like enzyme